MLSYTEIYRNISFVDFEELVSTLDHDSEDDFGVNPLIACVFLGDEDKVDYLLACGHDPLVGTQLATPISTAITSEKKNSADILKKLLVFASGRLLEHEYEYTPGLKTTLINGCIEHGNLDCMKLLLEYGCNPYYVDEECVDAFKLASEMKNVEATNLLKNYHR